MFAAPAAPAVPPPTPIPTAPPISAAVMEPQPPLIQLKWLEYPEALINGKKANRPILLHFHSHIGPAKKFQDEVLSDPNVQLEMQRFVLARIYMQDQQDLVKYYHVERAPTLIFLGADGYTRLRIDGPVGAEQLATQLARQR
jgi:thiol:disulfide interchange protein